MVEPSGLERPVLVGGTGRSGSTIVGHLLDHHPDLTLTRPMEVRFIAGHQGLSDALAKALRRLRGNRVKREHVRDHRSHSPKTTSMAERTAVVSASMWPFIMKSIACKWLNAVGRILQR